MSTKTWRRAWITAALSIVLASSTRAAPYAVLHWDRCDSFAENKLFSGPGIYSQVFEGVGFTAPVRGFEITYRVTPTNVYNYPTVPLANAWRFDPAGCQAGRLSLLATGVGQPCLSLAASGIQTTVTYQYNGFDDLQIQLRVTHDLVTPTEQTHYTLVQVDYDHTRSAVGAHDPSEACGMAERQACFVPLTGNWFDSQMAPHPLLVAPWGISWQAEPGAGCFGDLPVEPGTWGGIKSIYR